MKHWTIAASAGWIPCEMPLKKVTSVEKQSSQLRQHTIVPVLRLGVKQETLPFACTWPTISILVERLVENELFDSTLAAKFLSQDEERKKGQIHTSVLVDTC